MTSLSEFWKVVGDVSSVGVLGVSLGNVLAALGIFILFLMIRRLFFRFVISTITVLTKKTKTALDDMLLVSIEKPLEFAFVVMGFYFAGQAVPMSEHVADVFAKFVRSLIAFTLFWTLFRALTPLSVLMDRALGMIGSPSMQDTMKDFLVKLIKFVVICLGVAAVFQEWGFNVAAVLGSLGLVGMAVALGAKDFIANLFAGLTIFLDRMFEKGNWIQTPDVDGTVEDIGFRATKIRRFDKALVTIPNARLAGEALINFSRMTNRRIYWMIGLEYRTTKEQLRVIIQDISKFLNEDSEFETDPAKTKTFVFIDSFGASSIDVMLYCFTKTTNWGEWLRVKERLAYRVKEIVEGHGAAFAFPSTSLYVENLPFGTPEQFPLPGQPASKQAPVS
ncbi:MAG TPA: mechanosensitive ion channel family protein [Nitrospirales bacterium]|nr:mechanosensitive ion channel family protein [Nitrospirales bacterium]HIO69471.1 mechanosensitive ion channel family protein [Nitrospirales bacterium]